MWYSGTTYVVCHVWIFLDKDARHRMQLRPLNSISSRWELNNTIFPTSVSFLESPSSNAWKWYQNVECSEDGVGCSRFDLTWHIDYNDSIVTYCSDCKSDNTSVFSMQNIVVLHVWIMKIGCCIVDFESHRMVISARSVFWIIEACRIKFGECHGPC